MAAATTGSQQQAAPPAPTPNHAPAWPRATLDPKLLMAARRGEREALKDLLQHKDDDDHQQGRPDDEGSAAASTTTSVAPAPSTSISRADFIVEMEQGQDTPPLPLPLPTQQAPAVPPAAGSSAVLDADGVTMEGDSLLHVVAACGDTQNFLDCVHVIIRNKEKKGGAAAVRLALEARNNKGDTPLHCAARGGNARMISCLVDRLTEAVAAEVKTTFLERKEESGETGLQQALSVATKAFVGRKNKCGETALHQAVRAASKAAIDTLLAVDPELAAFDAGAASKAAIGKLLAAHPELAACIRDQEEDAAAAAACSPFYLAVSLWGEEDGEMDIARHLFNKTAASIRSNLSYHCSGPDDGRNVLHAAVSRASVKTVNLLSQLLLKSDVLSQLASQRDKKNGSTPLHLAASLDGLPSSLLVSPLNVWRRPRGSTPIWRFMGSEAAAVVTASEEVVAQLLGGRRYQQILPRMLSLVLEANEDMAYQLDKAGMYPIHVAAGSGSVHAVEMLLESCPDCATLRDAKGRTLLHVAAEEGRLSVVAYVCRPGPSLLSSILNAQDMNGDTPLHRAVHAARLEVVRRLLRNQQVRLDVPNNVGMRPIDVSWTTMPREAYYGWDPRIMIRRSLLRLAAPYGENNRGDLFRKCVLSNQEEEKMSGDLTAAAQVLALFSVLITTVTFASAFTLPGGSRSAGDDTGVAGTPVLAGPQRSYSFDAFILADTLAFTMSLLATIVLLYAGVLYAGVPAASLDNRFYLINYAYGLMWQAGRCLLAAFGLGLFIVLLPVARSIAIAVAALMIHLAAFVIKESEGLKSLGSIPMTGIGRSRQPSPPRLVLGWIFFFFNYFWSYVIIFGFPAMRRWPRFTLSPY